MHSETQKSDQVLPTITKYFQTELPRKCNTQGTQQRRETQMSSVEYILHSVHLFLIDKVNRLNFYLGEQNASFNY